MSELGDRTEAWAVATLEEKLGPDGAAALGVVMERLRRGLKEDMAQLKNALSQDMAQLKIDISNDLRRFERTMMLTVVVPVVVALMVLVGKLVIG